MGQKKSIIHQGLVLTSCKWKKIIIIVVTREIYSVMCIYMHMLITSLMQCGIISLLSPRLVRLSFVLRYSSALHTPTSFNNPQNNLYNLNLLLAFAGCGPHDPLRKSGGSCTMHGEQRHSWQWLSPCNTGALGEFLYPLGLSSPVLSVIEGDRYKYNYDCAMPGVRDCI